MLGGHVTNHERKQHDRDRHKEGKRRARQQVRAASGSRYGLVVSSVPNSPPSCASPRVGTMVTRRLASGAEVAFNFACVENEIISHLLSKSAVVMVAVSK